MESILGGSVSETYFVKQRRKDNFTILDNTCIRDCNLSWKAKGLHTYLMSLPEDWKICLSDLVNRSVDGRDSMNTAIKELENFGYLKRVIERKENGCFKHFCYVVFECPENQEIKDSCEDTNNQPVTDYPFTENPLMDKPIVDKPFTENPQLLTTNILNTNIQKTKLTNYDPKSKENVDRGVSESVFVKVIKDLFSGEYPFDKDFESGVRARLSEKEIDESNLESYLKYVFERTKVGNVQKSFEGLFRVLALSNSVMRDFKNSNFCKKESNTKSPETNTTSSPKVKCPICNTEFDEFIYYCPKCNLTVKAINENDKTEILVKKKLYEMTDSEREDFDLARMKKLQSLGRQFFIGNEQEEFLKEYGILANQT